MLWVLFAVCKMGSRGGLTAPPLCEDEALQCRHQRLGSDLCPSPHYYLTSCCLQQLREGAAARGFGSFWWGWLKAASGSWLGSPPPCEQRPKLTGFVLGSPGNPAWHLTATTSQAPLDRGRGSQGVLCILLETVTDARASPGTAGCSSTGSVWAERTVLPHPSTPCRAFVGHCTSLMTRPELQAGICSSVAPPLWGWFPVAIIYTRRYQFLTICSRRVCVNCCCCGSSLSRGHQFLHGSSRRTGLSDFLQGWVKVVEQVLALAPTGVSAPRLAMPMACSCFVRLGDLRGLPW